MSQLFEPRANTLAKLSLLIGLLVGGILLTVLLVQNWSPYTREPAGIAIEQPVRFSHEIHSDVLNIECLYCHKNAEVSAYAGIPDTHTCMSCHAQIATYSELLEPVRTSYETGERLEWEKVHNLADHVYFDHSAHVSGGVGCETCHGRVDQMAIVWQAEVMTMGWCLECHREPEQFVRPTSEIYTFGYEPTEADLLTVSEDSIAHDGELNRLLNCSICHR